MPRKGHISKRVVLPDPIYNSVMVTRLVNSVMLDGKKGVAQQIIYGAFDRVANTTGRDAIEVYEQALEIIDREVENIEREDIKKITKESMEKMKKGERDFYL